MSTKDQLKSAIDRLDHIALMSVLNLANLLSLSSDISRISKDFDYSGIDIMISQSIDIFRLCSDEPSNTKRVYENILSLAKEIDDSNDSESSDVLLYPLLELFFRNLDSDTSVNFNKSGDEL